MRNFLTALILFLAVIFVLGRYTELQHIVETLQRGRPVWIFLGLMVHAAWMVNTGLTYRALYRLLDMDLSVGQALMLGLTTNFANVVAPTAGMSGAAVLMTDAGHRSYPSARAAIAGVLFVLIDYFAFICVLGLGLLVLVRRHNLGAVEVGASAILLAVALALAGVLALGMRSAEALERLLVWLARLVNGLTRPLIRRDYLSEARAHTFAQEAAQGLSALRAHWSDYLLPVAFALAGKALMIVLLFLMFMAFQQPFSAGTLVAGFSLGFLFTIVSPTPLGLGVVEAVMPLGLRSLGVPLEPATVITLAYRGLTFWLTFGWGFLAFRLLQRQWAQDAHARQVAAQPPPRV